MSGLKIAKCVYDDVRGYKSRGMDGIIEDGSQRCFFPNGLMFYTYARTLFDTSLAFEDIVADYLSHIYGKDWRKFMAYLEKVGDAFSFAYCEGEESEDEKRSPFYSPKRAEILSKIEDILSEGETLLESHRTPDIRVQSVSMKILKHHVEFCRVMARALAEKALGNDDRADELYREARIASGRNEAELEQYYDQHLAFHSWDKVFATRTATNEVIMY